MTALCVCVCVRACVRACARACVCVCARASVSFVVFVCLFSIKYVYERKAHKPYETVDFLTNFVL